jgi:hypothetical protein
MASPPAGGGLCSRRADRGETMPVMTLYEEVENILTNRLRNALRTGEIINAPDWVSDLAARLALAVTMVEK